jgi:hypothetical protein
MGSGRLVVLGLLLSCLGTFNVRGNVGIQLDSDFSEDFLLSFRDEYLHYLQQYQKEEHRAFDLRRVERYVKAKQSIEKHNASPYQREDYLLGVNNFADMFEDEVRSLFSNQSFFHYPSRSSSPPPQDSMPISNEFAESLSWSTAQNPVGYPLVSEVHSQGLCGACWAFVTSTAVQVVVRQAALQHLSYSDQYQAYAILDSVPTLSAQQLLDCDREFDRGCEGGNLYHALNYVLDHGLVSANEYRYTGKTGQCELESNNKKPDTNIRANPYSNTYSATVTARNMSRYYVDSVTTLQPRSDESIYKALQRGPVGVGVCGTDTSFLLYSSGIYSDVNCCNTLNHALLIVGYGYDAHRDKHYWLALNSWVGTTIISYLCILI